MKGWETERALCLLFNELGLCIGFLWSHVLFIVPLLSLCWLALEVMTPLNQGLMGCHRLKEDGSGRSLPIKDIKSLNMSSN